MSALIHDEMGNGAREFWDFDVERQRPVRRLPGVYHADSSTSIDADRLPCFAEMKSLRNKSEMLLILFRDGYGKELASNKEAWLLGKTKKVI